MLTGCQLKSKLYEVVELGLISLKDGAQAHPGCKAVHQLTSALICSTCIVIQACLYKIDCV